MMKQKLEYLTKDIGISVTAIARDSGVSYSVIAKYLRGHTKSLKEEYVEKLNTYIDNLKQRLTF